MNNKRIPLLLSLTFVLAACGQGGPGGAPAKPAMPPMEVGVIPAALGSIVLTQDLPGRVQAVRSAQIRARVDGVVEKRLFVEGADIKAGTPLFQIDARIYKTAAEASQADLAAARLNADRFKRLLEQKAVSQQDYELVQAKFKQAEAALSKAEVDLENASIPAPISGRIGRAMVTEGALVSKSEATLLATIEQLDPVHVIFTQSGSDLFQLRQALKRGKLKRTDQAQVDLILEDGSLYPHHGRINFADMATDPNTGSVSMRAEFPNPNGDLLPGTFIRIRFPQARHEGGIRLPQRAVMTGPKGQFVLTVGNDGKVTPVPVKTGAMLGEEWLITEGLKGDEQVVVDGVLKARPGTVVKPVPLASAVTEAPKGK